MKINLTIIAALLLSGCSSPAAKPPKQLTSIEVFHLRSECAKLGQKLFEDKLSFHGANIEIDDPVTNYSAKSNRCYMEVDSHVIRPLPVPMPNDPDLDYNSQILYDAQTGEILATAKNHIDKDQKAVGFIFDSSGPADMRDDLGYSAANEYIAKRMKREGDDQ